jgi:hypothetical protein
MPAIDHWAYRVAGVSLSVGVPFGEVYEWVFGEKWVPIVDQLIN